MFLVEENKIYDKLKKKTKLSKLKTIKNILRDK
jgi:hypothetical protein